MSNLFEKWKIGLGREIEMTDESDIDDYKFELWNIGMNRGISVWIEGNRNLSDWNDKYLIKSAWILE